MNFQEKLPMKKRFAKLLAVCGMAICSLTTGCTSGAFSEELREFVNTTTQETLVAFGTFMGETAATLLFE